MPAEILFPVISDFIDPATDQKGNAMAKPNYQFKKRQKELAKKKRERKKGNASWETKRLKPMKLKKPPTLSLEDR